MGRKKKFLKVPILVNFGKSFSALEKSWFPYKAENETSKKGKKRLGRKNLESCQYGSFYVNHFQPKEESAFILGQKYIL